MIYIAGILGFIGGFFLGQGILTFMLRKYSNEELRTDKSLLIYGVLNWLIAALGAVAAVEGYRLYFGH